MKCLWSLLHDIEDIPEEGLNAQQTFKVHEIVRACRDVLDDIRAPLDRNQILAYHALDWKSKARQAWSRIRWDQSEVDGWRARVTSNVTMFNALMARIN